VSRRPRRHLADTRGACPPRRSSIRSDRGQAVAEAGAPRGAVQLLFDVRLASRRTFTTSAWAATRCCGSTYSGCSAIPRCTSSSCRASADSEILRVFSRKPLFGYAAMVSSASHRLHGLGGVGPLHVRPSPWDRSRTPVSRWCPPTADPARSRCPSTPTTGSLSAPAAIPRTSRCRPSTAWPPPCSLLAAWHTQ
jgi:hypothetical protein